MAITALDLHNRFPTHGTDRAAVNRLLIDEGKRALERQIRAITRDAISGPTVHRILLDSAIETMREDLAWQPTVLR